MPDDYILNCYNMVMNALINKEASDKCDYCNDQHTARDCVLEDGTERMLVVYDDGTFLGKPFIYERNIKFCSMCGRKLSN